MNWDIGIVWDGTVFWKATTHDGWQYRISEDASDPYCIVFRAYVDKPRREGHNRSSKAIDVGHSLVEAKYLCEKFERNRLASEVRIREAKTKGEEFERKRLAEAQNSHQ